MTNSDGARSTAITCSSSQKTLMRSPSSSAHTSPDLAEIGSDAIPEVDQPRIRRSHITPPSLPPMTTLSRS